MPQRRGHRLKFKFWLYLLIPLGAIAQTPSCNWKQSVTASGVGTSNANNTLQPTCNAFVLTWTSTGFTAVTIQLESSNLSGSGFAAFTGTSTVIAGTTNPTTALSGAIIVQVQTVLSFIRFNVTAATGSGTISTQIYGFSGISPAASAASGGGGGGGAIQTETWTAGTGGFTAGDLICTSQSGSPATAIKCPISVVGSQIEIAIIGIAQTTTAAAGSGTVIVRGLATCLFDTINAPTAGHLAQISLQTAGRCQDSGAGNANFGVPVLGVVMTTGLINTTQSVYVFSSGLVGSKITTVSPLGITNPASGTNFQVKAGNATSAQGNGTKLQFSTGVTTTDDYVKYDANGNTVDSGIPAGTATSIPFSGITGATNTTAAMLVGSGASVAPTGTGTITATQMPTAAGATATTNGQFKYDTTNNNLHAAQNSTDSILATFLASLNPTNSNCTNWVNVAGKITLGDAGAPCGSGGSGGGGIVTYSGPTLSILSGTAFCPIGGGGSCSATETNVDVDSPSAATVSKMYVQLSTALGGGNSVAVTIRDNAADTTVTCTISGAVATACNDTTHSFNAAAADLLTYKLVFTGTIIVTPTISIATAFGTSGVGVTSVSFTGGLISVATATTTPAFTVAGTSGGIPYFASSSTWASSAALAANGVLIGGGAGVAPTSTSAGTAGQVLTSNGAGVDPTFQAASGGGSFPLTIVQEMAFNNGASAGTTYTFTLPFTAAASGNTMFCMLSTDGGQAFTTPSGWTIDISTAQTANSRFVLMHKTSASDTTIPFTAGSNSFWAGYFMEVSGSHALDQQSTAGQAIPSDSLFKFAAITPTANSLVFALVAATNGPSVGTGQPLFYNIINGPWKPLFSMNPVFNGGRFLTGYVGTIGATNTSTRPQPFITNVSLLTGSGAVVSTFSIL